MRKPKILILDIETSMMLVGIFNPKTRYVPAKHLVRDWNIISAAWKWVGSNKFESISVSKGDLYNDLRVTKKLRSLLEKADIVVGHNIDGFDIPKIQWRMIKHKLPPLDNIATVDTLKVMGRRNFFSSYRSLDFLANQLVGDKKLANTWGLWVRLLKGDKTALPAMVKYNKKDIVIQEKIYKILLPYIKNHPNMNVLMDSDDLVCTNCGSSKVFKSGTRMTKTGTYQRYCCGSCGKYFRGKTRIKSYDGR